MTDHVKNMTDADILRAGLAFVPEDRAVAGIFRTLSVEQNISAAVPGKISWFGVTQRSIEKAMKEEWVRKLSIKLAALRQPIASAARDDDLYAAGAWPARNQRPVALLP